MKLTFEVAYNLFSYNPESGVIQWKVDHGKSRVGDIAGHTKSGKYMAIYVSGYGAYGYHRIAWLLANGKWPDGVIDHINGDPSDNRLCNLRDVSNADNRRNSRTQSRNNLGISGVRWRERSQIYEACICLDGKYHYLGSFKDKFEAICARKSAERKYGFHENHGADEESRRNIRLPKANPPVLRGARKIPKHRIFPRKRLSKQAYNVLKLVLLNPGIRLSEIGRETDTTTQNAHQRVKFLCTRYSEFGRG